jgi:hypothetical protein
MTEKLAIGPLDVLLVVDVQNDFCPGGSLAVPRGDEVVPLLNRLAARFEHVVLTQDWHPAGHLSFASSHPGRKPYESIVVPYGPQIIWPDHCVQDTTGAEFHAELEIPHAELVLRKGYHRAISIPIRPSSKTTARHRPDCLDTCGNVAFTACFWPGSHSIFASGIRLTTPSVMGSMLW